LHHCLEALPSLFYFGEALFPAKSSAKGLAISGEALFPAKSSAWLFPAKGHSGRLGLLFAERKP
jgi:hypothetical protein